MQLAIHHRPTPFCIGDIEEVRIGAARKAGAQDVTHRGPGTVTPGEVLCLADRLGSVRPSQAGQHARAIVVEAQELRFALDCARLHLALQWLGWSPGWTPPPEHALDWRAELPRLAARVGL